MQIRHFSALAATAFALSSVGANAQDMDDRLEDAAEASAMRSGSDVVALGLTEWQLLDAELVDANGRDLGDVEGVLRNADGMVDRLLVEIEDSDPDRYVHVPVEGLSVLRRGDDVDLSSSMTAAEINALPDADISAY